jgi:hypothetical protein
MRKCTLVVLLFLFYNMTISFAQSRWRFGLSIGATASMPQVTHKHAHGKLTPGYGINLYFPVSYKLNEILSIEAGLGYFYNKYKITYDQAELITSNASPFFPAKLCFSKSITQQKKLFASLGAVLQTAFARGSFDGGLKDSVQQVLINEHRSIKPCALINIEFGYKKITQKNKIHQISAQLFYGLQTQSEGIAYHLTSPGSTFKFIDKGHFAALQYTFWFGKRPG